MQLVVQKFRKALFVLPYICVVMEKTAHLQALAAALGIAVKGYWADNDVSAPLQPRCVNTDTVGCSSLMMQMGL